MQSMPGRSPTNSLVPDVLTPFGRLIRSGTVCGTRPLNLASEPAPDAPPVLPVLVPENALEIDLLPSNDAELHHKED